MAYLNTSGSRDRVVDLNLTRQQQAGGWIFSEFTLTGNVTTSDIINMFGGGTVRGWEILDWWVCMDQVDTNVSPTVAWKVGQSWNGTSISEESGRTWESNVPLGRVNKARHRSTTGDCMTQTGNEWSVGLQCTTLPATAAWAGKKISMGILVAPFISHI